MGLLQYLHFSFGFILIPKSVVRSEDTDAREEPVVMTDCLSLTAFGGAVTYGRLGRLEDAKPVKELEYWGSGNWLDVGTGGPTVLTMQHSSQSITAWASFICLASLAF